MAIKTDDIILKKKLEEDAWLNLPEGFDIESCFNPLTNIPKNLDDELHLYLIWIMSKPEYFAMMTKYIFNLDLTPMQFCILRTFWYKKFPMLIGSRGLSKCVKDAMIVTQDGFVNINDVVPEDIPDGVPYYVDKLQVLGEKQFNPVEYAWRNAPRPVTKIQTRNGYRLTGTNDHPIRVVRNNNLEWVHLEDIRIGDKIPIERSGEWFPNTNNLTKDEAYLLGALVGDGGYTVRGRISFTNQDKDVVNKVDDILYSLYGKRLRKPYKNAKSFEYIIHGVNIWDSLFTKYGFNSSVCGEKDIPKVIWSAKKEVVVEFIRGLMDTDGCIHGNYSAVELSSKSEDMAYHMQFLFSRFGIISSVKKQFNKKYQRYYYKVCLFGENISLYHQQIGFTIKYKQDNLEQASKVARNPNIDVLPHSLILEDMLKLRELALESRLLTRNQVKSYSKYRLTKYEMSYRKFEQFLLLTNTLRDTEVWQKLNTVLQNRYFYDTVKTIEEDNDVTYDVHIPGDHSFISNGFISHNTFLLAVYCLLRLLLLPKRKIVVAGAAFRQSKFVFEYMETIWNNAPVLRDLVGGHGGPSKDVDMWRFRIFDSVASFIPIGPGGDKIRGLRANDVFADEFSSLQREVFETVIVGFGAVSSSPIENMKQKAAEKQARKLEIWVDDAEDSVFSNIPNQLLLSGTAYYAFNHFAHYWKIWHKIIESEGDRSKIALAFGGEDKCDPSISHKDFAVIRIPYDLIPEGFMDAAQVARSRATFDTGTFEMEYLAIFSKDSNGFFKRTLVESCCVNHNTDFNTLPVGSELFQAVTVGNPERKYVFGIDPASEVDNFAIVVLEIYPTHRRIVHCWTINRKGFKERVKAGVVKENDYYQYCSAKIRELMKKFPTDKIAIDTQGGGFAILEALQNTHDGKYQALLPLIDPYKPKDTDGQTGLHIIDLVNFAGADYTRDANHGLRKDLEDKVLLFPYFDSITLAELDITDSSLYDGLEDCVLDIEELKDELATIVVTETPSGRQRWDTPDVKLSGGKKGRARKDRYSALLMANMLARSNKDPLRLECSTGGGFANPYQKQSEGPLYVGPSWFTSKMNGIY